MARAKKERQADRRIRYIGPAYRLGLLIPGEARRIRPAEMSPAERKAFLQRHPGRASWWQENTEETA